jgi:exosortase/archaeosortase family protein
MISRAKFFQILLALGAYIIVTQDRTSVQWFLVQPVEKWVSLVIGSDLRIGHYQLVINEDCSAQNYFGLILALCVGTMSSLKYSALAMVFALPLVWCINTSRIVLVCAAQEYLSTILSSHFLPLFHLSFGALIFAFGLVLMVMLFDRLDKKEIT